MSYQAATENSGSPLKPDMNTKQKVAVIVTDAGGLMIVHDQPFEEILGWVEYDVDNNKIILMSRDGNMYGTGLDVQESLIDQVKMCDKALVVLVQKGLMQDIYKLPVTVTDADLMYSTH